MKSLVEIGKNLIFFPLLQKFILQAMNMNYVQNAALKGIFVRLQQKNKVYSRRLNMFSRD